MNPLAAVVLCGGRSARMGQDKAGLTFRDGSRVYTMKSWMHQRWSSRCRPLLWAGPDGVPDRAPFAGQGPLAGVHAGLSALMDEQAGPWALLLAVDMPDFEPDWVQALVAGTDTSTQAVQFQGSSLLGALVRVGPVCALAKALLERQERRLSELSGALDPKILPAPEGAGADALRSSMNRPQDYERWLARRGFQTAD